MTDKDRGALIVSNGKQLAARSTALATRGMALLQTRIERQSLEALYHSTNGPHWFHNDGWLQSPDIETWHGVTCRDGHVIGLSLWINRLRGVLPKEMGMLTHLMWLNLETNNLSGPIPPQLGSLFRLEYLNLGGNRLSGPIPAELGNLSNLTQLYLSHNALNGPIPPALANLGNLTQISLSHNPLSGPIPAELGSLSRLKCLSAEETQLNASIESESELGNLSSIISDAQKFTREDWEEIFDNLQALDSLGLLHEQTRPSQEQCGTGDSLPDAQDPKRRLPPLRPKTHNWREGG